MQTVNVLLGDRQGPTVYLVCRLHTNTASSGTNTRTQLVQSHNCSHLPQFKSVETIQASVFTEYYIYNLVNVFSHAIHARPSNPIQTTVIGEQSGLT
jgi:hypothetical protein